MMWPCPSTYGPESTARSSDSSPPQHETPSPRRSNRPPICCGPPCTTRSARSPSMSTATPGTWRATAVRWRCSTVLRARACGCGSRPISSPTSGAIRRRPWGGSRAARSSSTGASSTSSTGGCCCAARSTSGRRTSPATIDLSETDLDAVVHARRPRRGHPRVPRRGRLRPPPRRLRRGRDGRGEPPTWTPPRPPTSSGDGRSWWARTSDGVDRLVRMQGADTVCPSIGRLVEDERLARIGAIARSGHEWGTRTGNRIEALVQADRRRRGHLRRAVAQGLLARPAQLRVLQPHRRHLGHRRRRDVGPAARRRRARTGRSCWPAFVRRDNDLPIVDLPTQTGDVTVHLSCTLHMAQPPVERERRVLYTGFRLPPRTRRRPVPRGSGSARCARRHRSRCPSPRVPVSRA